MNFADQPVCADGQYLDVVNNDCVKRSCHSNEIMYQDQCTAMDIEQPIVKTGNDKEELNVVLKTDKKNVMIANIINYMGGYAGRVQAEIASIGFVECLVFETFANNTRQTRVNDSGSATCIHAVFQGTDDGLLWEKIIKWSLWEELIAGVPRSVGDVQQFIITSQSPEFDPFCSTGSLIWHHNFALITSDFLGVEREKSLSLFIPESEQEYPISAATFSLSWSVTPEMPDVKDMQFGVCELAVYSCDKITVDESRYNVTDLNDTHSRLAISTEERGTIRVDAVRSDFAVTQQGSLLVVCSEALNSVVKGTGEVDSLHDTIQTYLTVIGLSVSIACLVVTFIVHCIFPSLQTIAGKLLMNLCMALLLAQLLFLISGFWSNEYIVCKVLAVCQHYSWLVSFCWMNVFAVDVSVTFVNMKRGVTSPRPKRMIAYAMYAWGAPACLCITAVFIHVFTDLPFTYGWETVPTSVCWISPGIAALYAFGIPIAMVILINAVCFIITLVVFIHTRRQTEKATSSSSNAQTVLIAFKLSTVMGFTWLFGFLANIESLWFLTYLFIIFNTLQGVFLFTSFICTKRVYRLFKHFVQTGEREVSSSVLNTSTVSQSTMSSKASMHSSPELSSKEKSSYSNGNSNCV